MDVKLLEDIKIVGKIDLDALNQRTRPVKKSKKQLKMERMEQALKRKAAAAKKDNDYP